ncbi:MAG: tetratricopeptide repeat protein [Flavobacteriales bacterium]|nr:tetratricopeptide repeat protein [Flavobacteriales bacterium]
MIEDEGYIEIFERYRNGDMDTSELSGFEARLAYDSEFKEAFKLYQTIESGIKTHFRNELKSKLKDVDKKMDSTPKKSKSLKLVIWSSSIAAAIVLGIFIFNHLSQPDYQQLAQEYWPHEEGLPVKMSSVGKYDAAMNSFKMKQYEVAEKLLLKIHSDTSTYYLGIISYEKNEHTEAIDLFSKIEKSSAYYDKAQFRLALAHLSQGNIVKARQIFKTISFSNSDFSEVSIQLLKKL